MKDDYFCEENTIHDMYKGFVLKCYRNFYHDNYIFYTYVDQVLTPVVTEYYSTIYQRKHIKDFREFIDSILSCDNKLEAGLAQLVEQLPCNEKVRGSIP